MRKWIGNLECPLPLSSLSNEEKLQKHLLFTYISAQNKYLRTLNICYQFPFHTLSALSMLNANNFENFHIDKRCCIIWCLMIGNKLPKMASKRPVWHLLTRQLLKEVIFAMLAGEPVLFYCPPAHFIPYNSLFSASADCTLQRLSEVIEASLFVGKYWSNSQLYMCETVSRKEVKPGINQKVCVSAIQWLHWFNVGLKRNKKKRAWGLRAVN